MKSKISHGVDKKVKSKKGVSTKTVVEIGAGVAALGAAAYLLLGPNGKKNQKAVKSWTVKMKKEVVDELKKAKAFTKPIYHNVVDKVQDKYSTLKNIDGKELKAVVTEIKKHWATIEKQAKIKPKAKKK